MAVNTLTGVAFLESLLGKTLRITTTDTRIFLGGMKCTDKDRNIILSRAYEYRCPPISSVSVENPIADMTSRFLGLVVIPGQYIIKIEVEEPAQRPAAESMA
ncbi:MAG: hypothetical protein M1829_003798 [Trizodia sp. TS-e1964]|nr:MAG: hypothetical protein M1829_003798 [Trizodia sp. TS-e1964]